MMTWSGGFPLTVITGHTRVTVSEFSPPPNDVVAFHMNILRREKCEVLPAMPHFLNTLMERQVSRTRKNTSLRIGEIPK